MTIILWAFTYALTRTIIWAIALALLAYLPVCALLAYHYAKRTN